MKKGVWIKRFSSFEETSESELEYNFNMTPEERLERGYLKPLCFINI